MKKIVLLLTTLILCLALIAGCGSAKDTSSANKPTDSTTKPSSSSKPTSSTSNPTAADTVYDGQEFSVDSFWESTEAQEITLPSTYEATVNIPAFSFDRAGVIFGTYTGTTQSSCFNLEIHQNGVPRVYIYDAASMTTYDIKFSMVNVNTGVPIHLAITMDHENGIWKCYVDGVLEETIEHPAPQPFKITSKARLGSDLRDGGNIYFKGKLQGVALYNDIRTEAEIEKDALENKLDSSGLICGIDLKKYNPADDKKTIKSTSGIPFSFKRGSCWVENCSAPKNYDYSFAVIGDIQTITYYYPNALGSLYDWIAANAKSHKIQHCISLGDLTEINLQSEYELVNAQYDKLKGKVPFSIIRGNHDREDGAASVVFDKNITQERYSSQISGAYDGTMKNTYKIQQIGTEKYLFLNLDYTLKDAVLDWANGVITANADCRVIIATHIYFTPDFKYLPIGTGTDLTRYGAENNGQTLWDRVISQHKNIVMVLNGHCSTDTILKRQKTGIHGNTITEILIDPQTTDKTYGGLGLVAMFYFSNGGKNVDVRYYSTVKKAYFLEENQCSIKLD